MIGDEEIDLTEDFKFGRNRNVIAPIDSVVERIHRFPWRLPTPIHSDSGLSYGGERLWGDTLSDEMGGVIRSTFNGGWFIGIAMKDRSEWFDKVFEELRLELGLIKPGWVPCFKCGRLHIGNPYDICEKCNDDRKYEETFNRLFQKVKYPDRYIPWNEYRTKWDTNEIIPQQEFYNRYSDFYRS